MDRRESMALKGFQVSLTLSFLFPAKPQKQLSHEEYLPQGLADFWAFLCSWFKGIAQESETAEWLVRPPAQLFFEVFFWSPFKERLPII